MSTTPRSEIGLSWWLQDRERWDLLRFEGVRHERGYTIDRWSKDRESVLEALIRVPGPVDRDFALFVLEQETQRNGNNWGFSHTIEIAAILVAEHRRVDDVWPLWSAICRSFDTWCGIPHRLLLAGGVARTPEDVAGSSRQQDKLLEHLLELPPLTDEDVTWLLSERRRHYADLLEEFAAEPESSDA